MDPTGGFGFYLLLAVVVIIAGAWIFAPFAWALGITLSLAAAFVAFIIYVFSNARFT